jgi:hypothetical protein
VLIVEICQSIALDNGTFAAWMKGLKYESTGYREWAGHWIRHPAVDWAVIPGVIDGDEATNDRMREVWDLPVDVSVPVYHMHECLRARTAGITKAAASKKHGVTRMTEQQS